MNIKQPKVLAATYNPVSRTKIISFLVDFPTCLLAELRTHRILTQGSLYEHSELNYFNTSSNSARAIPTNKYLQKILENPFIPIWTKNQSGMSGTIIPSTNEIPINELKDVIEGLESCEPDYKKYKNYKEYFELTQLWIDILEGTKDVEMCSTNQNDGFYGTLSQAMSKGYNTSKMTTWINKGSTGIEKWYKLLLEKNIHKQNANRLLAPFAYTTCILTGTEWENFFELRCPKYEFYIDAGETYKTNSIKELYKLLKKERPDQNWSITDITQRSEFSNNSTAQPEFQVIAEMLYDLYQEADWQKSKYHIPFEKEIDELYGSLIYDKLGYLDNEWSYNADNFFSMFMKVSASMCAKLSYDTQDNEDNLEKHLERADKLIKHKHWEVFSHQAIAMNNEECQLFTKTYLIKDKPECPKVGALINSRGTLESYQNLYKITEEGVCYNLKGFISQRYILENL